MRWNKTRVGSRARSLRVLQLCELRVHGEGKYVSSGAPERRLPLSAVAKSCVGLANYGKELIRVCCSSRELSDDRGSLSPKRQTFRPSCARVDGTDRLERVCACAVAAPR